MSFTFGAPPAKPNTPSTLFGAPAASTAASSTPLFGAPATSTATAGSLFGSPATTTSTAAPAPLFGSASTAAAKPLFGAPTTTTAAPSLFGSTSAAGGGGSLFGATSAAATPSLFGAATTAAPSLFGAPATSTTTALGGTPSTASVGLGGTTQNSGTVATIGGSGTSIGSTTSEKENVRDGEVPAVIVQLTQTIKTKLKENRTASDQFSAASSDASLKVKERIKEVEHRLSEGIGRASASDSVAVRLSGRSLRDLQLGKEAAAIQESLSKITHHTAQQHTIQHIVDLIREYDCAVTKYQEMVEQLTVRMRDIMEGKSGLTTADLKEYLTRFDIMFSSVAEKLSKGNAKVEELPVQLACETGGLSSFGLVPSAPSSDPNSWSNLRGTSSFPSQSTLVQISNIIKPAQAAAAPAGTTEGLFGSAPAGGSLFGGPSKPSLFGTPSAATTTTSLFPSLSGASAAPSSLFPSLATTATSKPYVSFGFTLSTNSTGLLFSSKK